MYIEDGLIPIVVRERERVFSFAKERMVGIAQREREEAMDGE